MFFSEDVRLSICYNALEGVGSRREKYAILDFYAQLALMLTHLDTTNWQKLIIDTLSHSPHLFVTGAHLVAKYVSLSITLAPIGTGSAVNATKLLKEQHHVLTTYCTGLDIGH